MLSAIYNYIFGYTEGKCINCKRKLLVKKDIANSNISCTIGCALGYMKKLEDKENKIEN